MFVTMFIGVINLKTGQMSYCNCGHNPPVIEGEFMQMEANVPMGLFTGFEFTDESIDNVENKMILLYTDGLNEAENEAHEQYGDDRLLAYMQQHANTAKTTINDLLESVAQHVAGAEPSDDLTMLCFKLHPIAN
jgi:serine phosphatase RsbU (regulator of sigma subunit)